MHNVGNFGSSLKGLGRNMTFRSLPKPVDLAINILHIVNWSNLFAIKTNQNCAYKDKAEAATKICKRYLTGLQKMQHLPGENNFIFSSRPVFFCYTFLENLRIFSKTLTKEISYEREKVSFSS